MRCPPILRAVGLLLVVWAAAPAARALADDGDAAVSAGIEPRARALVQEMSDFLGDLEAFSFRTRQLSDEIAHDGMKLQMSRDGTILVQRPNRFLVRFTADEGPVSFWYDGARFAMHEETENVFAQTDAPATIDATLDHVERAFGLSVPLADLLSDPAIDALITEKTRGRYVGLHRVGDVHCHHLAFRQPDLDWQIWIEAGERPLPRKLVITTTRTPGHPQVIADLDDFDLSPEISADTFEFEPPAGAKRLPFDGEGVAY